MGADSDSTINNNLHDNFEGESVDRISLTDFPITQHHGGSSTIKDDQNAPSLSAADDFFEFFSGGLRDYSDKSMMSHAEDIIFCGKLVPINEQRHFKTPPEKKEKNLRPRNQHNQFTGCRRSESMSEVKTTTMSPFVRNRNSRSLDYKKLNRNSSMSSEPAPEIRRDGSGKKYSSSRWCVLLFGLVKVPPPEMDLRDMKSRQVRRTTSKTHSHSSESCNAVPDHRKCWSRVLGFLSCKSSASATVTKP